jgi:dTMP kinase
MAEATVEPAAGAARGRFITFEGGEGAGKSTHCQRLAETLRETGRTVLTTREPGGSPGAEAIRTLLVTGETGRWDGMTELLLHYAARRDHVQKTVLPALARGEWVISDRFADSTTAYQGYGLSVPLETIETLHDLAADGLKPDLTLILDVPVEAGLARAGARVENGGSDRYERMDRDFHERLRQGFLAIAAAEPKRCAVIDATAEPDSVFDVIRHVVADRLDIALDGTAP